MSPQLRKQKKARMFYIRLFFIDNVQIREMSKRINHRYMNRGPLLIDLREMHKYSYLWRNYI